MQSLCSTRFHAENLYPKYRALERELFRFFLRNDDACDDMSSCAMLMTKCFHCKRKLQKSVNTIE